MENYMKIEDLFKRINENEVDILVGNPSKIKKELNWEPKYNFEQAIEKTILWYLENPIWCTTLRVIELTIRRQHGCNPRVLT